MSQANKFDSHAYLTDLVAQGLEEYKGDAHGLLMVLETVQAHLPELCSRSEEGNEE